MDAFYLLLALGPLAMYFLAVGVINLGRRPVVTSGSREIAALGLAVIGLVLIGPMQLFFPEAAANRFGPLVWVLLLAFYALCVLLWMLTARPRIVVYNVPPQQLRAVLAEIAPSLDPQASWAGDHLVLPDRQVQLHVQNYDRMRNVTLMASGDAQSHSGWNELRRALAAALRSTTVPRNPRGVSFVTCGLLMLSAIVYKTIEDPQALVEGLWNMIWR